MTEMVEIPELKWTYGWGRPVKYYGPGLRVPVPVGLARMLGYPVDASTSFDKAQEPSMATGGSVATVSDLSALSGLSDDVIAGLHEHGLHDVATVAAASIETLTAVKGIGKVTAQRIREQALALTEE